MRHCLSRGLVSASTAFIASDGLMCTYTMCQLPKGFIQIEASVWNPAGAGPAFTHLFPDEESARL